MAIDAETQIKQTHFNFAYFAWFMYKYNAFQVFRRQEKKESNEKQTTTNQN